MSHVDGGTDRRLHRQPEQTADGRYQADFRLAPVLLGHQKDVQVRTERATNIGQQEIDGIERTGPETRLLCRRRHSHSHSVPIVSVITVSGAPTRK